MKKRLRKKLHVREFKEMGFPVRFKVALDVDEGGLSVFMDAFLTEAVEANGLGFGGGGNHEWEGFITMMERGSATEEHRTKVASWLEAHPQVEEHEVGPLEDAWYGS
jgi:uncharacterized protein YggL (DUF469 family)